MTDRAPLPIAIAAFVALASEIACAYPEGAPWGAADPADSDTCASCHYDLPPVPASTNLAVDGLPSRIIAGATYRLTVSMTSETAAVSGYQLLIDAGESDAGHIKTADDASETQAFAARSVRTQPFADASVEWQVLWTPAGDDPVTLYVAASEANDDQSAFGDRIHYRRYEVPARSSL